ncbi:MAG: TetR/AcrR family transcriptional regulator [candidate division NC10 bacterium]|nr:TetR/AcrR family transcriptional regulator [candidate division NC10 bacterium]
MAKRAALAAETRRRIVDAAVALHAERGVLAAKPADIAAQADVALTTYYKHFPTIGDLVRACTTRGREVIPPPDLSALRALPPDPARRIEAMVRTLYQYYEAREPWLYAGRTEERHIPEVRPVMEGLRGVRDAFVRAALAGTGVGRQTVGVVTALVDFWAWRILRREVGLTREEVIRSVTEAAKRAASVGRPGHRPGRTARPRG